MRQALISTLVLTLTSLAQATFTFPSEGSSWPVGQEKKIKWDTAGIQEPINMYVGQAGAIDISGAKQIASGIPNTGSLAWTPDSSCALNSASLYGVDANGAMIHSRTFVIIITNNGGEAHHLNASTAQGMLTTLTMISTATTYQTLTSVLTTETIHTQTYVQTLHTPPAVYLNTSISTATQDAIITATPNVGTAPAANGTFVSPTATTGVPQGDFTGAAGLFPVPESNTLFAGGLVGLFVMGLI